MADGAIAAALRATGLCVCPGFLAPATRRALAGDLRAAQDAHGFHRAGTGQGAGHEVRDEVRTDDVCWLDRLTPTAAQAVLWAQLEALQLAFNRSLFLGLVAIDGHFAAYPAGGFYRRHLDRFRADDARTVSVIIYLNADWQPADGGALRIYGDDAYVDVAPRGGTLVCFLSGEREHEVLASAATRLSFAGWFTTRPR